MHNTRLVRLLGTLSSKERKRFSNYLESPYFGAQRMHRILYRYLEKYFLRKEQIQKKYKKSPQLLAKMDRAARVLDREQVLRAVYPGVGEDAAYKNLRRLSSELLDHWEAFLLFEKMQSSHYGLQKKLAALEKMREVDTELFEREVEKLVKKTEQTKGRDLLWYQIRYTLDQWQLPEVQKKQAAASERDAFYRWLKKNT